MIEKRCKWCRHSIGMSDGLFCKLRSYPVGRNSFCREFEREPGADDDRVDGENVVERAA